MITIHNFRFCPRCGHTFRSGKAFLKCMNCNLCYYFNPKPCTAILLKNQNDEYLLVKRAVEPKKGWWDLPGGFVEEGETYEEGARREIKEELGVDIKDLQYINSATDTYIYQDISYSVVGATFTGFINKDANIRPADDVADYAFFELANIPIDKIAFPSLQQVFTDLQSK